MKKLMLKQKFIWQLFLFFITFCFNLSVANQKIKETINVQVIKTLEKQLILIENELLKLPNIDTTRVKNITMPFQNYIEDVVLPLGNYPTCYPMTIFILLKEKLLLKKQSKHELAFLLIDYFINGRFKQLYKKGLNKKIQRKTNGN